MRVNTFTCPSWLATILGVSNIVKSAIWFQQHGKSVAPNVVHEIELLERIPDTIEDKEEKADAKDAISFLRILIYVAAYAKHEEDDPDTLISGILNTARGLIVSASAIDPDEDFPPLPGGTSIDIITPGWLTQLFTRKEIQEGSAFFIGDNGQSGLYAHIPEKFRFAWGALAAIQGLAMKGNEVGKEMANTFANVLALGEAIYYVKHKN